MPSQLPALAAGPRGLLVLSGPGAMSAPARLLAEMSLLAAARAGLPVGEPLGLSPADSAKPVMGRTDGMAALIADARAGDAPPGALLKDPVLAAGRTHRLRCLLLHPAPALAAVLAVAIADRGSADNAVTLLLAHCGARLLRGPGRRPRVT